MFGFAVLAAAFALAAPAAQAAPPSNDDFANAQDLGSAAQADANGTNSEASLQPGEEDYFGYPTEDGGSVWYRWTAPHDMRAWLDDCDTTSDILIDVYRGSSLDSLRTVDEELPYAPGCGNSTGLGQRVGFHAEGGVTYRFRVHSGYYEEGAFRLHLQDVVYDVSLSQTSSRKRIRRGQAVTYKIRETNRGNVSVNPEVVLLAGRIGTLGNPVKGAGKYVSVRSGRGHCIREIFHFGVQPGAVCDPGYLKPGESVVITARFRPKRSISHVAYLYWGHSDPKLEDDDAPSNDSPRATRVNTKVKAGAARLARPAARTADYAPQAVTIQVDRAHRILHGQVVADSLYWHECWGDSQIEVKIRRVQPGPDKVVAYDPYTDFQDRYSVRLHNRALKGARVYAQVVGFQVHSYTCGEGRSRTVRAP